MWVIETKFTWKVILFAQNVSSVSLIYW
jgi:hypothetical protein